MKKCQKITAEIKPPIKTADKINSIIEFLNGKEKATASEIATFIDLSPRRTREILKKMIENGTIIADGANKNRTYKLK